MPPHLLNTIKFLPSDNERLFAAEKGKWFGMSEKRVYMRGCQVCIRWKRNLDTLVLSASSGRAEDWEASLPRGCDPHGERIEALRWRPRHEQSKPGPGWQAFLRLTGSEASVRTKMEPSNWGRVQTVSYTSLKTLQRPVEQNMRQWLSLVKIS